MTSDVQPPRIAALDGLRGVAALMVVISHLSNSTNWLGGLLGFGGGQVGVMIFFALSGYLMGALYLNQPFSARETSRYATHRIARVAPLYYAIVVISFGATTAVGHTFLYAIDRSNVWDHILLIRGIGPLWTIPVEMQFYVAFIALWALHTRVGNAALIGACVLIACGAVLLNVESSGETLLKAASFFAVGMIVSRTLYAHAFHKGWLALVWNCAFAIGIALTFLLYPRIQDAIFGARIENMWSSPIYPLVVAFLLAASTQAPLAKTMLGNPAMTYLGAISYSVYLLHMPAINLLRNTTDLRETPPLFFAAVIITTIVAASISYFAFERPFRKFINRGARRDQAAAAQCRN